MANLVCLLVATSLSSVQAVDSKEQLDVQSINADLDENEGLQIEKRTLLVNDHDGSFGMKDLINLQKDLPKRDRSVTQKRRRKHRRHRGGRPGSKREHSKVPDLKRKRQGLRQQSCSSKTEYVLKTEADDIFGNKVTVHPVIKIGKLTMDQFFYESFCHTEGCKCLGMDDKGFVASCETRYSFTYARVIKNGEIGWTYIKVRSGCGCVVRQRNMSKPSSILDVLEQH